MFFAGIIVLVCIVSRSTFVRAEDCGGKNGDDLYNCLQKQVDDFQNQLSLSVNATTPLESEVAKLSKQVTSIQTQITAAANKTKQLSLSIQDREKTIASRYQLLSVRVRDYYKKSKLFSPIMTMVTSSSIGEMTRGMVYRATAVDQDKDMIISITGDVLKLEADKVKVESDMKKLASLQEKLDKQKVFFEHEIAGAKKYQAELKGKIASLSAQQQSILAAKTGTFSTTVGDVPLADDENASIDGFRNKAPGGSFAVFSFGAPHFKGMSQYGALGRAKEGQNVETILHAYYGDVVIKKDYDAGKQIGVAGVGRIDIETYVKRIYEVPNSWGDQGGMEALKAQAVAARTYALAWTREGTGGNICTDEGCQVYKNSNKGGNWEAAVDATRGWVMYQDSKIISPWYASTSGGYQESYNALEYLKSGSSYNTPAFWDTKNGRDGWTSQAYEKIGGSPWFYKAWYKSRSGDGCGRDNPWLSETDMADILNAWQVLTAGSDDRISPRGSCWGGNPYSIDELKNKGGFTSVSAVSVTYGNNGVTANVTFSTNKGSATLAGSEFMTIFNLRAPGRVSLKSGLYNIEKK